MLTLLMLVGLVTAVGVVAALVDLHSVYAQRRRSHIPLLQSPAVIAFVICNGAISAGLLLWAVYTADDSPINSLLGSRSDFQKALIVGFSVPLLLKSRLCSIGAYAGGPALAYDWFRAVTLRTLANESFRIRLRLQKELSTPTATIPRETWFSFLEDAQWMTTPEKTELTAELEKLFLIESQNERSKHLVDWMFNCCGPTHCRNNIMAMSGMSGR